MNFKPSGYFWLVIRTNWSLWDPKPSTSVLNYGNLNLNFKYCLSWFKATVCTPNRAHCKGQFPSMLQLCWSKIFWIDVKTFLVTKLLTTRDYLKYLLFRHFTPPNRLIWERFRQHWRGGAFGLYSVSIHWGLPLSVAGAILIRESSDSSCFTQSG